jgi:hypothetical protein
MPNRIAHNTNLTQAKYQLSRVDPDAFEQSGAATLKCYVTVATALCRRVDYRASSESAKGRQFLNVKTH